MRLDGQSMQFSQDAPIPHCCWTLQVWPAISANSPVWDEAVYDAFTAGAFLARRSDGHHNGGSLDMLLAQTYNADAKDESGLDGIICNEAARMKWFYTKPVKEQLLHPSPR